MNPLRFRIFCATLLVVSLFLTACNQKQNAPEQPSATPTVAPTNSPTPSPEPSPTATPTPTEIPVFDILTMTGGGANACAKWNEDGTLAEVAEVVAGGMIYCNNFETTDGNVLPGGNAFDDATTTASDAHAASGKESICVSMRTEQSHGLSGFGLKLDATNGLDYAALVGHTIELTCSLFYTDEGFGAPEEVNFTLYDTYHTEIRPCYTYDRNNEIVVDSKGNPVMKKQEAYVIAGQQTVPIDTWTECTFRITVSETKAKDGMWLLGTVDEKQNFLGMYCTYFVDNLILTVIE